MAQDTASLKISVDSRDVKNSTKDLDNLSKSSSNAENSAKQTTSAFKGLGVVLSTVAAGALAKEFIQTADTMNMLNARLRLVTSSLEEYKSQQTALLKISKDSYSPLADIISLYTKLDPALKRMGATTAGVNEVVDSFSKGLKLGGASAAESSAAMLQFAQAMGSGVLRGDEFNSMMEASPKLMTYVAEGMGKPVTALRKLAEEGKLTAGEVSAAMLLMSDKIEADFKTLPKTVSGALTNIKTDLALMVDEINNASGVTENLAKIMSEVGGEIGETSEPFIALGVTISQTTLDIVDITKEVGSLLSAFNEISSDGAGISLFEAGLTGLRISLDTIYVGLHNSIVIAKELINAAADFSKFQKPTFLEDIQGQILTVDDLVKRYTKSLDDSTKSHKKNNDEAKKTTLDKKTEIETILAKSAALTKEAEAEKAKEKAAKKAIKAEEDRLKKSHEIAQSQLKMIQDESDKKIKLQEDYQNTLNDLVQKNDSEKLDGLAKEAFDTFAHYDSLIEKYKEVAGAESALRATQTMAIDTIIEKQKELDEAYANKTAIDSLDEIYGRYEKLIDAQIELAENGMNINFDFGDGAKELNNISKAMQQLHVGSLKYTKQDMKMQEDFAKRFLEAKGDELKEKEIVANFDADNAKLKEAQSNAEMAAYSSLAGAMVGAFEKGSAGAIAFTTLQSALGIASSWAAIATAWALPFPANIPAAAMVAANVLPIIAQLGGSGGGSGSGSSPYSESELSQAKTTELNDEAYINRLDQQIALLEAIEKNGSAQKLSVDLAAAEFTQAKNEWVQDVFDESRMGWVQAMFTEQSQDWQNIIDYYGSRDIVNPYEMSGGNIRIDSEYFRSNPDDLIKVISDMTTMGTEENPFSYTGTFGQDLAAELGWGTEAHAAFMASIESSFTEIQGYINDWAISVVDSTAELKDASEDMKTMYDDITGSTFYADKRLTQAFEDFDNLLKDGESYGDYLVRNIDNIEASTKYIYEMSGVLDANGKELSNYELLLSKDGDLIEEQMAKVAEFGEVTGQAFEDGAEEALNYIDSIEMVAEAMATSRENIDSFIDSFKTSEQLAQDMASTLGVAIATTGDELVALFNNLSGGVDGLTDAELEFLNASKDLIDSGLDDYISSITSDISSLESVISSLSSVIDNLKGAAIGSTYSMQKYYDSMSKTLSLSGSDDIASFQKSLNDTISASSVLFDTANFTTSRDQQFAQLVAANQFSTMEDTALEQIDYLRLIEINTREQIDVLVEAMRTLGSNISKSIQAIEREADSISTQSPSYNEYLSPDENAINNIYQDVLGRSADYGGLINWTNQVDAGLMTIAEVEDLIRQSDEYKSLNSFAVGTPNVPYDMIAQIHKNEMIVPETINQGIQNGNVVIGQNNTDLLVRELNNLNQKQNAIITKLQEQLDTQNSSAESLEYIAKVS